MIRTGAGRQHDEVEEHAASKFATPSVTLHELRSDIILIEIEVHVRLSSHEPFSRQCLVRSQPYANFAHASG
jgi:hypothetical protein